MKQDFANAEVKEFYVPPTCECVEVYSEGILCASDPSYTGNGGGVFEAEGDRFIGEW